jgi:uncharacterized protein YhdP
MRAHGTRQRVLLERPMTRTRKLVLFGLAALAAVVALVAVGLGLLLDTGAHKARLQATASQVLGLEVDIAGSLALDFSWTSLPG